MKRNWLYILYIFLLTVGGMTSTPGQVYAAGRDFVLVIDAGHGGHDPGAVGKISKEKNINLKTALRLGQMVERQCPDVKVVYTRKRDVFVPLDRRAEIANNAQADLFISIHTNSLANNHTAQGASTWTLGLAKSDANLEVAKRENSVILYEDDYKTRYAGFNPGSSESYIIFEFMQDKYMKQSVHLASLVQKQLRSTCKRVDRGVHQAGFLVLKASAMPSILIELGFISTPAEERYLNSDAGISKLAEGIFRAFLTYKQEQQTRVGQAPESTPSPLPAEPRSEAEEEAAPIVRKGAANVPAREEVASGKTVFKIQICTSSKLMKADDRRLKGLKGVEHYREGGLYKYTYGASEDYNRILRLKREIVPKFKDAFIIAFKDGQKVDVNQAIREFKQNR